MERQTTGQSINYTQGLMQVNFAQQGWQCPICKRVLAPFVPECPCGGQGMETWTTTTTDNTNQTITLNEQMNIKTPHCYYNKAKHFKGDK